MGLLADALRMADERHKEEVAKENRVRTYNDIAFILWYSVLYEDVLAYKNEQMDQQQQNFRIYDFGNVAFRYGPVVALKRREDIERFEKQAKALLADKGFGRTSVKVHGDSVVVSWI